MNSFAWYVQATGSSDVFHRRFKILLAHSGRDTSLTDVQKMLPHNIHVRWKS